MAKTNEKQADEEIIKKNLSVYERARQVPASALKKILGGRLKGMSDVNPMFRIKRITEIFGPCGFGWKYEIVSQKFETQGQEVKCFMQINLYVKMDDKWSEPIPGVGGSDFVSREKSGLFVNDECLDGDCEVLTPNGWVKFKDYNGNDEVCQFDNNTHQFSFVKPIRFIKNKSNNVIDKGGILMTANHRVLCYNVNKKENVVKFANTLLDLKYRPSESGYGRSSCYRDIKCGLFGRPTALTTLQKIGIMLACDGTIYRVNSNGAIFWRLEFSKERKIIKAKKLLDEYGLSYKENVFERSFGKTTAIVFTFGDNINYKNYSDFIPYGNYPELWEEIVSWDGCSSGVETFTTTKEESASYLQTLLALSGQEVKVYYIADKGINHSPQYMLYRKKHSTGMAGAKRVEGTFDMYCVEVPTSFFLIRKGYDILVTGNCEKMALTDALSVAMKALGIAADVYWDKDGNAVNTDSKYAYGTQPQQVQQQPIAKQAAKPAQPSPQPYPELDMEKELLAESEANQAQSSAELTAIWNKYTLKTSPHYHPAFSKDGVFRKAVASRGQQLKAEGK